MSKELAEALEAKKGEKSLRQLARDLDVAPGTAESWLKDWRTPEIHHIRRLAVYLGVEPCDILQWEMDDLPNPEIVVPLNVPLGRRTVYYGRPPGWDGRPTDNSLTISKAA